MKLSIYLFGHFQILRDGLPQQFALPARGLSLWAYLLLHRDQPVPREHLAYLLWPDLPESEARAGLRRHFYELRRQLPDPPDGPPWWLSDARIMQWNPASLAWLDVAEFERLSAGTGTQAQALDLYRGDLLTNLYDDWLIAERLRLRTLCLELLRSALAGGPEITTTRQHIACVRRLLVSNPLDEEAAQILIELLLQSGDRSGALLAYQEFARRLKQELNLEPQPEMLHIVQAAMRSNKPVQPLPAAQAANFSPPYTGATPCTPRHNLPAQLTSFIGRQQEMDAICEMIASAQNGIRLLTITGPGGVGKTRLSLEAATRLAHPATDARLECFQDGIYFVSLAALQDPNLVLPGIAAALEIVEDDRPLADTLKEFLRPRKILLVLDNFEQVLDAALSVTDILAAAPQAKIIVTSRSPLNLYGEQEFPLELLPLPGSAPFSPPDDLLQSPAVALFVARARSVNPSFSLNIENAANVAEICTRLDGLPLALELAAGQSRSLPMDQLLVQLENCLEALAAPYRNLPLRHQALRAAIDWSYQLLDSAGRDLFARLGVFAGSFSPRAAGEIALADQSLPESWIVALLNDLASKSMLRPQAERRYTMLLTLREFALEKLGRHGESDLYQNRHAEYYRQLAQQASDYLYGPQQIETYHQLENELDNLRAAHAWALQQDQAHTTLVISAGLLHFWEMSGRFNEGSRWLDAALQAATDAGPQACADPWFARASYAAAWLRRWLGDLQSARRYARQSLECANLQQDLTNAAWATLILVSIQDPPLDYALAHQQLSESLETFRRLNNQAGEARALQALGTRTYYHEDYPTARQIFLQSLEIYRQRGDLAGMSHLLNNLGLVSQASSDPSAALEWHQQALDLRRRLGVRPWIAQTLNNLAGVTAQAGNPAKAIALLQESLRIRNEVGASIGVCECLEALGVLARDSTPKNAAFLLGAAEILRRQTGATMDSYQAQQYANGVQYLQTRLSTIELQTAWHAGQSTPLEQVIQLALNLPN